MIQEIEKAIEQLPWLQRLKVYRDLPDLIDRPIRLIPSTTPWCPLLKPMHKESQHRFDSPNSTFTQA
jgi:hypothetical protein